MKQIKTDICVIGAGSGGLSVAAGAVQMGARVVLIENGAMGGDCLNYGCVPSKSLIHASKVGMGYAQAMEHVRSAIDTIAPHDSQERFEALGCTVIREHARFTSPKTVEAGEWRVRARRFVIATGSRPMVPPVEGLDSVPYLTNETLWELRDAPKHLLILGGGPIGMEMAQAHRRFGCRVTVIDGGTVLANDDPEAVDVVKATMRAEGVDIREGQKVTSVAKDGDIVTVTLEDGTTLGGSHLLVAAGRISNADKLALEKGEIDRDRGGVKVNAGLRTSNRRVYAVGDVISDNMNFTHVAGYQGGVAIRALLFGLPAKASRHHIPYATYTDPEQAQIGMTEAQAVRPTETGLRWCVPRLRATIVRLPPVVPATDSSR